MAQAAVEDAKQVSRMFLYFPGRDFLMLFCLLSVESVSH